MGAIPFTQYFLPNGRRGEVSIERPEEICKVAKQFLDAGGCYECEVLSTGHVSLTAVFTVEGEKQDIAIELVPNGPSVPGRVDKLVRKSVKCLKELQ